MKTPMNHQSQRYTWVLAKILQWYLVISPMRPENLHRELVHLATGWGVLAAIISLLFHSYLASSGYHTWRQWMCLCFPSVYCSVWSLRGRLSMARYPGGGVLVAAVQHAWQHHGTAPTPARPITARPAHLRDHLYTLKNLPFKRAMLFFPLF